MNNTATPTLESYKAQVERLCKNEIPETARVTYRWDGQDIDIINNYGEILRSDNKLYQLVNNDIERLSHHRFCKKEN
jgi:hypothetical protein